MAYAKVEETFWHDPKVRALTEDGRNFFLYLMTCPHKNRIGCFVLDLHYAAADLQWVQERVAAALAELQKAGRAKWDAEHRCVFVRRHAKHNTLENQQVVKGALADLRALPDTPLMDDARAAIDEQFRAHYKPLMEAFAQRLGQLLPQRLDNPTPETPYQPLPQPLARQPVTATDTATVKAPVTDIPPPVEPELTRQTGSPPVTGGVRSVDLDDDDQDGFARFVEEYPDSVAVLKRLKHKGGKVATRATIRARLLYPDVRPDQADPALKGIPLAERLRIFAGALLEYAEQGGKDWSTRAVVGYMGRLHRTRGEQDREEQSRREKANEGFGKIKAEAEAKLAAEIEKLNEAARARGFTPPTDPSVLTAQLAERFTLKSQGSSA